VLNNAEMGGFDDVRLLENPDRTQMENAKSATFQDALTLVIEAFS